ncbi:transient receptor potential cation channel subfamily M member 7-like [Discoglossus pictus]
MHKSWIEKTFHKRDCVHLIPTSREPHRCIPGCQICQQLVRCCCGRLIRHHVFYNENLVTKPLNSILTTDPNQECEYWTADTHTVKSSTDAYGTINFHGGTYGSKAKYIRLSNDSKSEDILQLMLTEWRMKLPKLIISVHGGVQKFELHPSIKEVLSQGFIKAAMTTNAWILTGGVNNGAAAHIGEALKKHATRLSHNVFTIGIAPWGVIEGRDDLIGKNVVAPYQTLLNPLSKLHVLNSLHSHFILVDDGTVGRSGGEVHIRRELERMASQQQIHARSVKRVPVVAFILEGGPNIILTVLEYLQQNPPMPVVICEGSGGAADLLAYVHKQTDGNGNLPEGTESEVFAIIKNTFNLNQSDIVHLFQTLMTCMRTKELITVYHAGSEKHHDIDAAILTAIFKGINSSPIDQLALSLAWDRVDIARNHIFVQGQQWLMERLEQAMLDALIMDRVEFVKLLIENGVSMHKFLTIPRLEVLYNASILPVGYKITLIDVGLVIEYLMGGTYRCSYTKKHFRAMCKMLSQADLNAKESDKKSNINAVISAEDQSDRPFTYPFNDLLVWAVLTKRQKMALFMWQHGEESMAKALVARKLYKAMFYEERQSDVIDDAAEKLKAYSKEFGQLAVELLDQSFRQNDRMTMKLLTYELRDWSKSTCLKLAVSSRLRLFVAHTCTQMLLSDMWMGGLNMRKNCWYKVIFGILFPPIIPMFGFKTKAQMSHIPQSQDAHQRIASETEEIKCLPQGISMEVFKEVTFSDSTAPNSSTMCKDTKSRHLQLSRKFHAFYHAPIVKFWFNTLAYLAFLMLYTYVVLVKMESLPSVQEWIVVSVIFSTGVEKIREIFISEAGKIPQKLKVWFSRYLNINDTFAIITFLVGFGLRFGSREVSDDNLYGDPVFVAGRLIYCLNTIFWFVRLLDNLNVNQDGGPYVLMIGKMVSRMFYIVVIMGLLVVTFGVPRKGILYPQEDPSWTLARDIVFQPYFMTYGEVYAYEIDPCANNSVVPHLCGSGTWLNPFLQAVYLFVQYIIMVNLLIALFNNVYVQGKAISNILWKFQRYHFVMFYHDKPILPPPFILFCHVGSFISWMCIRSKKTKSRGPKLFLTEEDRKRLHEFEESCMANYFNDKNDKNNDKSDERIRVTSERVEQMCKEIKDVGENVNTIKHALLSLDHHIGHLQDLSGLTLDTLKMVTAHKALETSRSHSVMSCDLSFSRHTSDDGLGRSTTWRKSSTDLTFGRSFSQPSQEKANLQRTMKSLRKCNISDVGCVDSAIFQRGASLPEIQCGTFCEEKNTCLSNQKPKSLKSRPNIPLITVQSTSSFPSPVLAKHHKEEVSVCKNGLEHESSQYPEVASSSGLVSTETYNMEGIVNHGFIDDHGKNIAVSESDIKDNNALTQSVGNLSDVTFPVTEAHHELEKRSSVSGVNSVQEIHPIKEPNVKSKDSKRSTFNGNNNTSIFQKMWNKSKFSGNKHQLERQMSVEIHCPETETYLEVKSDLRRANSCTELTESQNTSTTQLVQMDSMAAYEDVYQTDSMAALLKDEWNSPTQKEAFNGFGFQFTPSMDNTFYYSAIERNNLYRLSQSIQFTPLPPKGELVTVYQLEESSPQIMNLSMSSWSHQGGLANIEFLGREEMGGGLRRAVKVACTWSEYGILKAGHLYILKSFLPEVVNAWSEVYKEDTVLQLCLREIQQQRAAQKLLFAFNQMKPKSIPYSPKFLEVFLLYCHSAGQWFTVEEFMPGRFRKYNNNTGSENVPTNKLEKTMLAFSHWTYEYTKAEFLVLDLQGVGEHLTDPSVIKAGDRRSQYMVFGPANLGDDAIRNFCSKHQCNSCCRNLKLPDLKRNDYTADEVLLE